MNDVLRNARWPVQSPAEKARNMVKHLAEDLSGDNHLAEDLSGDTFVSWLVSTACPWHHAPHVVPHTDRALYLEGKLVRFELGVLSAR